MTDENTPKYEDWQYRHSAAISEPVLEEVNGKIRDFEEKHLEDDNYVPGTAIFHFFMGLVHGCHAIGLPKEQALQVVEEQYQLAEENYQRSLEETPPSN